MTVYVQDWIAAKALAERLYWKQVDQIGARYFGHLERVVNHLLVRWPDSNVHEIQAAWLHDAAEDHNVSIMDLLKRSVTPQAISLIAELSRVPGSNYDAWLSNLANHGTLSAIKIKLADLRDLSDPERVKALANYPLQECYVQAAKVLEEGLARHIPDQNARGYNRWTW